MFGYTVYSCATLGGWIIVIVGLERMVAVFKPLKVKIWFTRKKVSYEVVKNANTDKFKVIKQA